MLEALIVQLSEDFTEWDAYKLGLIDENGKILREACDTEEKLLPSEKLAEEIALSDTVKLMIKIKKYIGEGNLNKLDLYIHTLKEKEEQHIREHNVIVEKVNKKHKMKDIAFDVEKLLMKEGVSRQEYLAYLLGK